MFHLLQFEFLFPTRQEHWYSYHLVHCTVKMVQIYAKVLLKSVQDFEYSCCFAKQSTDKLTH